MTDDLAATLEVAEEVVQSEAEQAPAPEAAKSTEGVTHEATADDASEGESPDETSEDESQKMSRSQRRREAKEAMQQQLRDAETAREAAEKRAEQQREAAKALKMPQQGDFETYEQFQAAVSTFQVLGALDEREALKATAEAQAHYQQAETIRQQQAAQDAQNWADQMADARTQYPDFDAVALGQHVQISEPLAQMLAGSDQAADIAYHLGKNPALGGEISGMDPVSMARAVGRLEAQMSAPKPKTTSTAPEPITPVRGKATPTLDPEKMSMKEYAAARAAGKI